MPEDNLEDRVSALETHVQQLDQRVGFTEQDTSAARVLAGAADRDVDGLRKELTEFRRQNNLLHNATRQDIADLRSHIMDLERRVDDGFTEMRGKIDGTTAGLGHVVDLLNTLIERE